MLFYNYYIKRLKSIAALYENGSANPGCSIYKLLIVNSTNHGKTNIIIQQIRDELFSFKINQGL